MSFKNLNAAHLALAVAISAGVTMGVLGIAFAREITRPAVVTPGNYAGVDNCKKCHFDAFRSWKSTEHQKAFDVLPAAYKADPKCLACHTTGHGQPGGFTSAEATAKLAGVQCEMCHGPGAAHAEYAKANEEKKGDPAVVAELKRLLNNDGVHAACWRCHLEQTHGEHPAYTK